MMARANLSGKSQIIVGDKTTHGGVVISGSPTNKWHGISIARKTDKVYCPKCKPHIFEIAEGLDNFTDTDSRLPVATEGHLTTCGAALIAEAEASEFIMHAMNFMANESPAYDQHFLVKDKETGNPIISMPYKITLSDRREYIGITDKNGLTEKIYSNSSQTAIIEIPYYGNSTGNPNSCLESDSCRC
jgi:uncharacterized Zn-binding protein involved in type VI secretion